MTELPLTLAPTAGPGTAAVLLPDPAGPSDPAGLPRLGWVGPAGRGVTAADVARAVGTAPPAGNHGAAGRAIPLLPQISTGWRARPGLTGHRPGASGADWSTAFATTAVTAVAGAVSVDARDDAAGLALRCELQSAPGGVLRIRHTLTNLRPEPYLVEALDVIVPIADRVSEVLDTSGRWGRERQPQRRAIADGSWVREARGGRPGHDAPTQLIAGTDGFGFGTGEVWALHVAWSGNSRYVLHREPSGLVTLGGGELLLPGEMLLGEGESYATPWVLVAAADDGLDGIAAQFHGYARGLPARPALPRPVTTNVWEAVYFDHDLDRLRELADRSAAIGIERFVLDDGWFGTRRDDTAGLGDWTVSGEVWPDGLGPLIEHVRAAGMQFGLWFEPEMVNPDSELFRAHPDWVLGVPGRDQPLHRNQLVLDLSRPEVRAYLFDAMHAVLAEYPISYVKWDHNRELHDAASGARHGGAVAHAQTEGYYALLDRLRAAHPDVEWESCASGGGRVDLGVLERVQRVWTSDVTDALSRQLIQRWTTQLLAPEYVGAHVSAPVNHQTHRTLELDFRAATAFFGDFGVEWDVSSATEEQRDRLAGWIAAYKRHRALLHSGRVVRVDCPDEQILCYGVVAADGSQAVAAYVQLDEVVHDPLPFVVAGLDPRRSYTARTIGPEPRPYGWDGEGLTLSGAALAAIGLPAPHRRPASAWLVHLQADPD